MYTDEIKTLRLFGYTLKFCCCRYLWIFVSICGQYVLRQRM